ncbi:MAG: hypothetical protein Q4Q58_04910 [Thermoplasmata archaeon]|nr:hypothetical protein [Thermoplasmata archaeon]
MDLQPDSKNRKKLPILRFDEGGTFINLSIVSNLDERTGEFEEPGPRITANFGGSFVSLPLDGKWWKNFSKFANQMCDALQGIAISNSSTEDDLDYAKFILAKYRTE